MLSVVVALAESLAAQGDTAGVEELAAELAWRAPEDEARASRIEGLLHALRGEPPTEPGGR